MNTSFASYDTAAGGGSDPWLTHTDDVLVSSPEALAVMDIIQYTVLN